MIEAAPFSDTAVYQNVPDQSKANRRSVDYSRMADTMNQMIKESEQKLDAAEAAKPVPEVITAPTLKPLLSAEFTANSIITETEIKPLANQPSKYNLIDYTKYTTSTTHNEDYYRENIPRRQVVPVVPDAPALDPVFERKLQETIQKNRKLINSKKAKSELHTAKLPVPTVKMGFDAAVKPDMTAEEKQMLFEQMVLGNYEIAMVTPASTGDEVGDKGKKDGCVLM